jgi:hypothetical protein
MTEFKTGDRVQKVAPHNSVRDGENNPNGPDTFAREAAMGALGAVIGTAATHLYVKWDSGKTSCVPREVVAPAEDHGTGDGSASDICAKPGCNCDLERRFPAPLDPSKVKPGDTVTVRVEPNPGTGWGTLDHGPEAIEVTGTVWLDSGDNPHGPVAKVGVHALDLPNVTLTDHQPAPEPEPEYMVGHVYEAKVANVGRVQVVRVDPDMDEDPLYPFPWFAPSENDHYTERAVTDVRPLVVLDPESDTDRLWNIIREVDGNHDLGAGALAEAILERLSR